MTSGLKFKGNMIRLMRNVNAFMDLFEIATRIEAGFPE